MEIERTKIGYLIGGGLKENFRVRLTVSPQDIQEARSLSSKAETGITMAL